MSRQPTPLDPAALTALLDRARRRREPWVSLWRDAYDHALPLRGGFVCQPMAGRDGARDLYDGTAPDAVDQLAAALLATVTPPWTSWVGLAPGPETAAADRPALARALDTVAAVLQGHLDRSNFAVEAHQCFLDLVVGGTACLLVEEAPPGALSAFRFSAVALADLMVEEGPSGRLETVVRRHCLPADMLTARYPAAAGLAPCEGKGRGDPARTVEIHELQVADGQGHRYAALLADGTAAPAILAEGRFDEPAFLAFRWVKAPGEVYGRSPVMKALPDIKTANKVVELILKNASLAVTGIWQADDDGVINPSLIKLVPGTIIPKAVGSAGLKPLEPAADFDIGQLVLDDLRRRIRSALLADQLAPVESPRLTATEVLERADQMARALGAVHGRLLSEFLVPLLRRTLAILRRRGEVPDIALDGRQVVPDFRSPLARAQGGRELRSTLLWLDRVAAYGPLAEGAVDMPRAIAWLGERLGVPAALLRGPEAGP